MGIKGIYRELGLGKRVSLSALAAESLEKEKRPLRIAIDIAIWQYQTQAARGGSNPAIRTLFYRLVRLLGTPIQPVFVFDGPQKPRFKRHKRSGRGEGAAVAVAQAKRMIRLFGFVAHDAPGEAEAECAYLQQQGVVDAVLSDDVDTIMFGCTRTLRNWAAEGSSSAPPTHVSLYDAEYLDTCTAGGGLGREGMVLVALMSGGDYIPEGVPGAGLKVACEAARAGFGKSVCRLKASDKEGIERWRGDLIKELRTNESGYFRTRHKALVIPDDFPNMEVLRYYTHPVVSQPAALETITQKLRARHEVQLGALREFAREVLDWDYRGGALKFIRVLGRAMLVHQLVQKKSQARGDGERELVHKITCRRTHASCDGLPEMRLSFSPGVIVPIDLSKELDMDVSYGRDGLALNSDDEFDAPLSSMPDPSSSSFSMSSQTVTSAAGKAFDPAKPELAWVLEGIVKEALPRLFHAWEETQAAKSRPGPAKGKPLATSRARAPKPVPVPVPHGAMDRFTRVTKPQANAMMMAEKPPALSKHKHKHKHRPVAVAPAQPADWSQTTSSSPISHSRPSSAREVDAHDTAEGKASSAAAAAAAAAPSSGAGEVAAAGDGDVPRSIRAVLSQGGEPEGLKMKLKLKQKRDELEIIVLDSSDDEATASQPLPLPRPRPRPRPPSPSPSQDSERRDAICTRTLPSRKRKETKRLIVPGATGSFDVIELDEDQREARIDKEERQLAGRRGAARVQRWSEVEILDLTAGVVEGGDRL